MAYHRGASRGRVTHKKAERITGCTITSSPQGHYFARDSNGEVVWIVMGKTDKEAYAEIVDELYKLRSKQAMQDSKLRCAFCGGIVPLQAHHKIHRSKKRDDRAENLAPLCSACHERQHK